MTLSSRSDQLEQWRGVILLIGFMLLFQLLGPEILRYDTRRLGELELWRLFSGHWVHANWAHYGMNMAGLALCQALTGVNWSIRQWVWRIVVLALGISMSFWLWQPGLDWYVGFSGVLFGLYVLAAVASWRQQRWMSLILLAVIVVKIALEQVGPVDVTSGDLIGVPVLVNAHLYGVLAALLVIAVEQALKRIRTN